jgi:tellurite resistance protein TehA-like permease
MKLSKGVGSPPKKSDERSVMRPRFERGRPDNLETLHPAYFALIMATGIVALATYLHGIYVLSSILFWLNAFFFIILVIMTGVRIVRYPDAFAADLHNHRRGVGFFTLVAAFGVFGSELVLQMQATGLAIFFWIIAATLWFVVTYGILTLLAITPDKPSLADGINGSWLVMVVATQSVSILAVLILTSYVFTDLQKPLMFTALILWLGAGAIYLWLATLIFFRYMFLPMSAEDLTPHHWINMGAAAISVLAGTTLLGQSGLSPIVAELEPFVKGLTLLFYAIATWWIPMLVALGIWRHLICGVPLSYDPLCWGGVFPLGMYSVCTYKLVEILGISFLMPLSNVFMIVAVGGWIVAFAGLVDSRLNSWHGHDPETDPP